MTDFAERYKKNEREELFLKKFNSTLAGLEKEYIADQRLSDRPVIFVCGAPRSGTTLLTQVLAGTGLFNYIDNFTARFWRAPFIGLKIEKILGLRNLHGSTGFSFTSDFGRTSGITGPHEFAYFWEHWLKPETSHHVIPVSHLKKIDIDGLRNEIQAILSLYNKPLFFKSIWFLSNPLLSYRLFTNVYFIFITRDLLSNALSILNARVKYLGDENKWFSVLPLNYSELKGKPVEVQALEQIKSINDEINKQAEDFPEKVIRITYEELCGNPVDTILKISDYIGIKDIDIHSVRQKLPSSFTLKNMPDSSEALKRFKDASRA